MSPQSLGPEPLEKVSLLCVVADWKFMHHVGSRCWLLLPLLYMSICAYKDSGMCLCRELKRHCHRAGLGRITVYKNIYGCVKENSWTIHTHKHTSKWYAHAHSYCLSCLHSLLLLTSCIPSRSVKYDLDTLDQGWLKDSLEALISDLSHGRSEVLWLS